MRKFFLPILLTFLCCLVALVVVSVYIFSPASPSALQQTVIVPRGESTIMLAKRLVQMGILRHSISLRILTRFFYPQNLIQSGSYTLSGSMSPREILVQLSSKPPDVWVTIPEGLRSEEIAALLEEKLTSSFFKKDEFLLLAKPVEGRLYPDTYLFSKESSAQKVFSVLTATFEKKYALLTIPEKKVLSREQYIILASLIERESLGRQDAFLVSGVLHNRLEIGMPLQVDATLQYILGSNTTDGEYWKQPVRTDKERKSPFNTYLINGLPPTPICNPGSNALDAALHPSDHSYLYYIHGKDGKGHYATTYQEHQKNIATYL